MRLASAFLFHSMYSLNGILAETLTLSLGDFMVLQLTAPKFTLFCKTMKIIFSGCIFGT